MPTTLTEALAHAREWERHHSPALPKPRVPKEAEDRIAARITDFAGSMRFVYLHAAWFALWIVINVGLVVLLPVFDPFPFGLLTLIVSLEAIFLSTFVMIAQNRLSAESDARAESDYQINVRAEGETARLLYLVQALLEHGGTEEAAERTGTHG